MENIIQKNTYNKSLKQVFPGSKFDKKSSLGDQTNFQSDFNPNELYSMDSLDNL